ncbi:uncharacterized protein TEOVI_000893600 [Trypanosoma equiperdum]|uniref:Thioredoxin n=1 Tax=Trypanosoma equiperdum TaxID=5694 RepID=A0A1G4I2D4_TRYEQ|nr:hypothetical protein, conserved [Trypanosoma equiperdum]
MLSAPRRRHLVAGVRLSALGGACGSHCSGTYSYRFIRCSISGSRCAQIMGRNPICVSSRSIAYKTDASSFEREVIQSQQAICLVYYRPDSSGCNAYLAHTERLVDRLNEQACGGKNGEGTEASMQRAWLKLCTINADENRNLASAFSVERAKLPITYFIMQGTIIDKVTGQVTETRLEGILRKFLDHYQQQLNVDLMGGSPNKQNPLPAAAGADLLHGASTQYLQNQIMAALLGTECIRLPEESEKLDGLRKTIQQAKKKAFDELQELRRELGVDVRRLGEAEMMERYYKSSQYSATAVLSGLEALFLARVHATIGNISAENVLFAVKAIQRDFEPALGDNTVKRLISLCEALVLRAELHLERKLESESGGEAHVAKLLRWIDELVDARLVPERYPSSEVEEMFNLLKLYIPQARRAQGSNKEECLSAKRVRQVKTCLLGVLQLFHDDPKSQEARLRLSSLLY